MIGANTLKFGKSSPTENGNAARTCGTRIFRQSRLLRKNNGRSLRICRPSIRPGYSDEIISMNWEMLTAFQNRFFKNFEGMYYSRREGILTPELWDEIDRTMSDFLAYKGIQDWWQTRRHWHTEAFA